MNLNYLAQYHRRSVLLVLLYLLVNLAHAQTSPPLLVNASWLKQQLGREDMLIIDTRDSLQYEKAHIPGAINIPIEDTFATTGKTYRVGNLIHIKALFSQHGITHQDHIVVYDDGSIIDAARFFWVLEVYGHQRVSLVDGGISHWLRANYPLEQKSHRRQPSNYIPSVSAQRLTTKTAMQIALSNPTVSIIDARAANEYDGQTSSAARSGHIPGAINIPWTLNMQNEAGLASIINDANLTQQYQAHKDKHIITYCNRGKQSALTYFALRQLGYEVSVYDGAWLEWADDQTMPIE